jgi:hypothetical protein
MTAREIKSPFIVHSPVTGQRREGDYGAYALPADTPEPDAPKVSAPPAEEVSQEPSPPALQLAPALAPPSESQS